MALPNSNHFYLGAVAALFLVLFASHANAAGITITGGWIRALPAGLPAAGYFTLRNSGDKTVLLTGAASPGCAMLMLHKSDDRSGMMKMEDVTSVEAAPGATVKFTPGSYHLMCMGPKPAIKPGGRVPVTLSFADGTSLTADFAVRNANGE